MIMQLSENEYLSALQCPKMLWLMKNKPYVFNEKWKNNSSFYNDDKIINQAKLILEKYEQTSENNFFQILFKSKNVSIKYDKTFNYDGLSCRIDVLKDIEEKTVEVYNIKISDKRIKEADLQNLCFEFYVLNKLGYKIECIGFMIIDKEKFSEKNLNFDELFKIIDATKKARNSYKTVENNIENIKKYLLNNDEPKYNIGLHCHEPYICGFYPYCTKEMPKPNFLNIAGIRTAFKYELYHDGLISFEDLKDCNSLSDEQKEYIMEELKSMYPDIEECDISDFLKEI